MNNLDKIPKAPELLTLAWGHLLLFSALPTEKGTGVSSKWTQIWANRENRAFTDTCVLSVSAHFSKIAHRECYLTLCLSAMVRIVHGRGRFWRAITIFKRRAQEEPKVWSLKLRKYKPHRADLSCSRCLGSERKQREALWMGPRLCFLLENTYRLMEILG